jgi:ribosomal protein L10
MAITKAKKVDILGKVEEALKDAVSLVFVNFKGLSVADTSAMRKALKAEGVGYYVAKKTLVKRALQNAGYEGSMPEMEGELALAWSKDATAAARSIWEAGKTYKDTIFIRGGVFREPIPRRSRHDGYRHHSSDPSTPRHVLERDQQSDTGSRYRTRQNPGDKDSLVLEIFKEIIMADEQNQDIVEETQAEAAPAEEAAAPAAEEKAAPAAAPAEEEKAEVPAKFKKLVEEVENMSVLELSELVKALEKRFGVSAAAVAVAGPAAGAAAARRRSRR